MYPLYSVQCTYSKIEYVERSEGKHCLFSSFCFILLSLARLVGVDQSLGMMSENLVLRFTGYVLHTSFSELHPQIGSKSRFCQFRLDFEIYLISRFFTEIPVFKQTTDRKPIYSSYAYMSASDELDQLLTN